MAKRVFLIVLDSFGIGYAPDAALYGDEGSNTLASVAPYLHVPVLKNAGLFHIDNLPFPRPVNPPLWQYGALIPMSSGKDTTTGHWEMAGLDIQTPFPVYPNGFPHEIICAFEQQIRKSVLCNLPYSGTAVLQDYGLNHRRSASPIVYTSADSVFQIACHTDVVSLPQLYEYCEIARRLLVGKHGVARVIARPFSGTHPHYVRTAERRDFSLPPIGVTLLDKLVSRGLDVLAVGKIRDIFASRGITEYFPSHSNDEGVAHALRLADRDFSGLCFVNLVDFDMLYGHRNDIQGYAAALNAFDRRLAQLIVKMGENDMLVLTADHGCDPGTPSTDHSRERVPLLVYRKGTSAKNLGEIYGLSYVSRLVETFFD